MKMRTTRLRENFLVSVVLNSCVYLYMYKYIHTFYWIHNNYVTRLWVLKFFEYYTPPRKPSNRYNNIVILGLLHDIIIIFYRVCKCRRVFSDPPENYIRAIFLVISTPKYIFRSHIYNYHAWKPCYNVVSYQVPTTIFQF